jgi:hypothetical protein
MATKKPEVKNAVATQEAAPFAMAEPSYLNKGAARGSEDVKSTDMVLPRLEIVQSESPIKEEADCKEGDLFNSVTMEIYGDLVYFVPVYFRLEYLVWKLKDEGGGFFGAFPTEGEAKDRLEAAVDEGNMREHLEIVDTPVQYGLRVTPDGHFEQIVISMAKSKAKVSRKWNSIIQIVGGDRFSRVYKVSTFRDENNKGKTFRNYVVQPAGFTPEPVYRAAEELYKVFKTSDFRAAHETVVDGGESTGSVDRADI